MKSYYFVTFILSFLNLAVFIYRDNDKKTSYYLKVLLIIVCLANFGYLALGVSSTLEEAILANKITYLGGCFMPPIMAACMCSLCNIKLKRWIKCICILFSAAVYAMVLSTGFSNFYYLSIRMGRVHDATALIVEHGIGYNFFYIILYGYIVADIVITIIAFIKKQVTKKNLYLLIALQSITIIAFLMGMASMVENRDNSTGGHIKRTSDVIGIFIETIKDDHLLELSDQFCRDLIKAAPMHDLGKIAIEDRILQKPGRFTEEEFEIMKTHAEKSAEIIEKMLRGVEEEHFVNVAVNVARYHHEKWNGMGYPVGLSGEHIPLEARIMAIADVYDALVSKRCYKEAMSFTKAYEIIIESMGSHFDPSLEQVFIMSRHKLESYYANAESAEC